MANTVAVEVMGMLTATWLMMTTLLYSLQLNPGSFPRPLSHQEEQHYLALAQAGDLEARNVLIEHNLRLVAHIMKKYYAQSADQEDLISIGTIGLIKGIQTFDPGKGARLATYAARCIENATLTPTAFRPPVPSRAASAQKRHRPWVRSVPCFFPVPLPGCPPAAPASG